MSFVITYNSFVITTSAVHIDKVSINESFERTTITCDFILESSDGTVSTFTAEDAVMRAALSARFKNLQIEQYTDGGASVDRLNYSHAANTGMQAQANVTKIPDEMSTGISSKYRFTVSYELPADEAGRGGRRSGNADISQDAAERTTATFSGVYTGTTGPVTAYANASTNAPTWATGLLTTLGFTAANFEALSGVYSPEQENQICSFRLVYQEVIDKENVTDLNSAPVVNAVVDYKMTWPQRIGVSPYSGGGGGEGDYATGGGGAGVDGPPPTVVATYTAQIVDSSITGDTYAETLYRETLKPWLLSHMSDSLNFDAHAEASATPITEGENWNWSPSTNSFSGTLMVTVPASGVQVIRYREAIYQKTNLGKRRFKLWDGRRHTYSTWSTGATAIARQTITVTRLSGGGNADQVNPEPPLLASPWDLDEHDRQDATEHVGSPGDQHSGGETTDTYEVTSQFVRTYTYVIASSGGGSARTRGGDNEVVYAEPVGIGDVHIVRRTDAGFMSSPVPGDG